MYYKFSDGTYAISYGVEKASNLVNPHYSSATGGPRTYGSFIGNSSAISQPSTANDIETTGEALGNVGITIIESGAISNIGTNTNLCGGTTCRETQSCVSEVCTDLCGGDVCTESQSCVSDVCTDLCGGQVCVAPQTCVSNVCSVATASCTDKTTGQTADGGTSLCVSSGYMVTPSNAGTMSWDSAMTYCTGLELDGFSDWYLPSFSELTSVIYTNRGALGIGSASFFWSSTEAPPASAACLFFAT